MMDREPPVRRTPPASQYSSPQYDQPPTPRRTWVWLLIVVGGIGAAGLFVCCGGIVWLAQIGDEEEEAFIQAMIENDPVVVENIGEISTLSRDWMRSLGETDDTIWFYNIRGNEGTGVLTVTEEDGFGLQFEYQSIVLETSSGEVYDLYP